MRVVFAEKARDDLIAIGDYIAKDNPLRALSFVDELKLRCEALEDTPFAYALIYNRPETGIRRLVHGRYGIFYRSLSFMFLAAR